MTGRWLMQSIQMTFAIMPALDLLVRRAPRAQLGGTASYAVVGTLVSFTTLQTRLFAPIGSLLSISVDVQSSLALFDRIFEYLDLPVDIDAGDARRSSNVRGEVALEDVWFRYGDGPYALEALDHVPPGRRRRSSARPVPARRRSAISSRGSTTRRRAASRSTGSTSASSRSSRSRPRSASSRRRPTSSTRACARTSASPSRTRPTRRSSGGEAAQIHKLIASLPEGFETVVGERGYRFSGGEKQRIAIARRSSATRRSSCSTRRPRRSTPRPSAPCRRRSTRLVEGRTTIAIAHRLSTVRDADQIVVLDGGRVVETGTYDELVARGGRFAALAARDFDSFDADAESPSSPSELAEDRFVPASSPCRSRRSSSGPGRAGAGLILATTEHPAPRASPRREVRLAARGRAVARDLAGHRRELQPGIRSWCSTTASMSSTAPRGLCGRAVTASDGHASRRRVSTRSSCPT